jgi:predicted nuclease of predicted toxin-antitoxin system
VRLKLDENLPEDARAVAVELGHDADTVRSEGLSGHDDIVVIEAVRREDRFLITLDRGFGDIRRYPPGTHPGIAVMRVESQDASTLMESVRGLVARDVIEDLRGCLAIVGPRLIRVRRPG